MIANYQLQTYYVTNKQFQKYIQIYEHWWVPNSFLTEFQSIIIHRIIHYWFVGTMPVRVPPMDVVPPPPPPAKSKQPGVSRSLLYNGSKFKGHQKSKGNQYDVEVILQVKSLVCKITFPISSSI